jgi:ectoine hydroxylase-related dioxygenase (phytanoyl-CoA dioxygenase family)
MNLKPLCAISDESVRVYAEDGVVCLRQMFDRQWCERMYGTAMRYMRENTWRTRQVQKEGEKARFYISTFMCNKDPDFLALRERSPMAEIAATLMHAEEVRFFYDQLFIKEPGTSAVTQWHQDLPFWPMMGEDIVSIWLALTPVSLESSGVEYVAGSHRWGKFYRAITPDEDQGFADGALETCPDFGERHDDPSLRFLSWTLEPGDVVCHHPLTVHGARGNSSQTQPRVGVSLRYLGKDVRWDPRKHVMPLPVDPAVEPGRYPADDVVFPRIWSRRAGLTR